jgi:RNA polymerase sigma-70 factor (ECF subfamily)
MATEQLSPETRPTLIQRVSNLDPESWTEFVALYDALLLAYVGACDQRYQLGLNAHDREDIKQEILIKLYYTLPSFELRGRFRTWLWKVAHNAAIDWVRRHHRRGSGPQGETELQGSSHFRRPLKVHFRPDLDAQPAPDDQPDEVLIQDHLWHMRRHILEKVRIEMQSAHKWDCFDRHFLQGRPSATVATELNLSVSAVNTNTSRVLARIRALCLYYDVEL